MNTPTPSGATTTFSAAELKTRTIQRRAVEAVIWGMPAVNYDLMYQAMVREAKGAFNQVVYWSRLSDWKNQTLTPNPDAVYVMPFVNTRDAGPMVLEIPPADDSGTITGSVDDCWQTAIEDVGPAGVDKGKGGKYLILPPGHIDTVPDGYIAMRSPTYRSYALLRSNPASGSGADVAKAVAYAKRIKLYPYSAAASPPATRFVDAFGIVFDATIPYDVRFFEALNRAVQDEVWLERDRAMIDPLRSLGIEKGKPFQPDTETSELLRAAAVEARAWLEARYEAAYTPAFAEGARWALPVDHALQEALQTNFGNPETYPVDARGVTYSFAFFSARHLGAGQFYLLTINDRDGRSLDGGNTYRLTVPPHAPVRLYWSATAYDRSTHALIRAEVGEPRVHDARSAEKQRRIGRRVLRPRRASRPRIQLGADARRQPVRGAVSSLRSGETALRQDMETARHRQHRLVNRRPPLRNPSKINCGRRISITSSHFMRHPRTAPKRIAARKRGGNGSGSGLAFTTVERPTGPGRSANRFGEKASAGTWSA